MKKILSTAAVTAAFVPLSKGAITHYDISDQVLTAPSRLYIDFDTGAIQLNANFGGADAQIRFVSSEYQYINYQNTSGWKIAHDVTYFAIRYSLGAGMNFGTVGSSPYLENSGAGSWNNDSGASTVFLGLRHTDNREAWIGVRYNDPANTLTVMDFAVAPGSDNMTAGMTVVPEPAATGVVMALLAGCAGLYHRRRELARQAKAPAEVR